MLGGTDARERFVIPALLLANLALPACQLPELPDPRNCQERQAYYPDEDGDGIGEPTQVFIGCAPPDGWVLALPQDSGRIAPSGGTADTATERVTGGSGAG